MHEEFEITLRLSVFLVPTNWTLYPKPQDLSLCGWLSVTAHFMIEWEQEREGRGKAEKLLRNWFIRRSSLRLVETTPRQAEECRCSNR